MKITPKTVVKTRINADCTSHSRTDIKVRDVEFIVDEPAERGGTNMGPAPVETALSSLVACTNVIGHKCANKLGLKIDHMNISLVADFDRRGVTLAEDIQQPFPKIELTVDVEGDLSEEDLENLKTEVEKYCPVSRLFRNSGSQMIETWRKKVA